MGHHGRHHHRGDYPGRNIYEEWTRSPDRFSWFGTLFKALGVGLIAAIAINAPTIIAAFTSRGGAPPTP